MTTTTIEIKTNLTAALIENPGLLLNEIRIDLLVYPDNKPSCSIFIDRWYIDRLDGHIISSHLVARLYYNVTPASRNRLLTFFNKESDRNEKARIRFYLPVTKTNKVHMVFHTKA